MESDVLFYCTVLYCTVQYFAAEAVRRRKRSNGCRRIRLRLPTNDQFIKWFIQRWLRNTALGCPTKFRGHTVWRAREREVIRGSGAELQRGQEQSPCSGVRGL